MNTPENQERQMLADSVRKWADRAPRGAAASTSDGQSSLPSRWTEFAELGWLAVAVPEDDGGLGGSLLDVCIVAEELGRAVVPEPYVAAVALGGMLLADVATGSTRPTWLAGLADGSKRVAVAPWELQAGNDPSLVDTVAISQGGRWQLDGEKALSPGAAGADGYIAAARTGSGRQGLFLIEAGASGLRVQEHQLYDGRYAASLQLAATVSEHLLIEGPDDEVQAILANALDRVLIAHCAETVGTMGAAFEITREYLGTRKQFGRPIAANQVVQHRLVDLYVEIEELRALWRAAAVAPVPKLVAALGARTSEVARHTWQEAIQLHGAIGLTEEYTLGAYVRRLALAASLYGAGYEHLERLADLSLH